MDVWVNNDYHYLSVIIKKKMSINAIALFAKIFWNLNQYIEQ